MQLLKVYLRVGALGLCGATTVGGIIGLTAIARGTAHPSTTNLIVSFVIWLVSLPLTYRLLGYHLAAVQKYWMRGDKAAATTRH
jgi:hypothetical protein